MNDFENWLCSSVAESWEQVRLDNDTGHIWNEQDVISSFYAALRPYVERRNRNLESDILGLRLLTELMTKHQTTGSKHPVDLALVQLSDTEPHIPAKLICQFEFKYYYTYYWSYIERMICSETDLFRDGNRNRYVEIRTGEDNALRFDASTDFVFFGLVATDWEYGLKGKKDDPRNNRIIHPNGIYRHHMLRSKKAPTRISEHKAFSYFELHGPISESRQSDPDRWGLYEVSNEGVPTRRGT